MNDLPVLLAQEVPESPLMPEPSATVPISNVPQIVIENLPPSSSGLTQPWATVIAGLLAIAAATIAYFGIRHQAKQNMLSTKAQLKQQRMAQERELEATDLRQSRAIRLETLVEANQVLSVALLDAIKFDDSRPDEFDSKEFRDFTVNLDACENAEFKLDLVGASDSALAMKKAVEAFSLVLKFDQSAVDITGLMAAYDNARETFRTEVDPILTSQSSEPSPS